MCGVCKEIAVIALSPECGILQRNIRYYLSPECGKIPHIQEIEL
jgi:hypothetical protein